MTSGPPKGPGRKRRRMSPRPELARPSDADLEAVRDRVAIAERRGGLV